MATDRGKVDRFGFTEKARSAGPWPFAAALNVSQSDSAFAVHSHSLAVSMLIVPDPPADVTLEVLTFNVTAHRCADGLLGDSRVVDEELQAVANAIRMRIDEYRNRTPPEWAITSAETQADSVPAKIASIS